MRKSAIGRKQLDARRNGRDDRHAYLEPELTITGVSPRGLAAPFFAAPSARVCLRASAAPMKLANSGCGPVGRDLSSGWNWQPMNHGWSGSSTISAS